MEVPKQDKHKRCKIMFKRPDTHEILDRIDDHIEWVSENTSHDVVEIPCKEHMKFMKLVRAHMEMLQDD